ncbi:MAG: T9SS type A sorting domain-containing protein, partial [bacterium]|nr:T9SS type A sorting domain-containing protein [bacterium]
STIYQSQTKASSIHIDFSSKSPGLYFVKIIQGNNLFINKIIKQ